MKTEPKVAVRGFSPEKIMSHLGWVALRQKPESLFYGDWDWAIGRGAVAELATGVKPPTFRRAGGGDRAGKQRARGYLRDR